MSDYTPSTEQVREAYATRMSPAQDTLRRPMFDRWLASVKAEAWEQGKRAEETAWIHVLDGHPVEEGDMCDQCPTDNPYREQEVT